MEKKKLISNILYFGLGIAISMPIIVCTFLTLFVAHHFIPRGEALEIFLGYFILIMFGILSARFYLKKSQFISIGIVVGIAFCILITGFQLYESYNFRKLPLAEQRNKNFYDLGCSHAKYLDSPQYPNEEKYMEGFDDCR